MVVESIIEKIQKAEAEALKKGIETNTIILNTEFDLCREFWFCIDDVFGKKAHMFPPSILGKTVILGDLPKDYVFALTKTNVTNIGDYINNLEEENKLLKKYIHLQGSGDCEQFVFKRLSKKKHKEDFEKIKEVLGYVNQEEK